MTRKQQKLKRRLARLDLIQFQSENGTGLPRPLAKHGETAKPVAWTQSGTAWGRLDAERQDDCVNASLCLVCGEEVLSGVVLWSIVDEWIAVEHEPPASVGFEDLSNTRVNDNGPLHDICAKITRAHCQHIRERMANDRTVAVPYIGPVLYGHA